MHDPEANHTKKYVFLGQYKKYLGKVEQITKGWDGNVGKILLVENLNLF